MRDVVRRAPIGSAAACALVAVMGAASVSCPKGDSGLPTDPEEAVRRFRPIDPEARRTSSSEIDAGQGTPTSAGADPARAATESLAPAGTVEGTVRDAVSRRPVPARVLVEDGGGTEPMALLPGVGFWCDGRFSVRAIPGLVRVSVSGGGRRICPETRSEVGRRDLALAPGSRGKVAFELVVPGDLRFESAGWHGADLFRPVAGGSAIRGKPDLALLALAARAEGVAFLGAGEPWGRDWPLAGEYASAADRCASLSGGGFEMVPACRGSDQAPFGAMYFLSDPHVRRVQSRPTTSGEAGALAGSFARGSGSTALAPNFLAVEAARLAGALSVARDVACPREMDPRADVLSVEPGLAGFYGDAAVALGGAAWELPFLAAAGLMPDALDLTGSEAEFAVWFKLLSMGQRVPAVHTARGSFAEGVLPAERTFVELAPADRRPLGSGLAGAVIAAVRAGRVSATNGPFVFLTVDGRGPGSVLRADGTERLFKVEAYASTGKGSEIGRVEIIRNGEVRETIPGEGRRIIVAAAKHAERETAWYVVRAFSPPAVNVVGEGADKRPPANRGEGGGQARLAWTSPVYFEGPSYVPLRPFLTRVRGRTLDSTTGRPLPARVEAHLLGNLTAEATADPATGAYAIEASPAASISARLAGYASRPERIFFRTGALAEIRAMHVNASGRGAAVLAEDATYERMRQACAEAEVILTMTRIEGDGR